MTTGGLVPTDTIAAGAGVERPCPPPLGAGDVHVWRIALDRSAAATRLLPLLDAGESARARRFFKPEHQTRFIVAHGALRQILAAYLDTQAARLTFAAGENGKPALAGAHRDAGLEFNLSHSADLALVAVARGRPVGVDVERWDAAVEHLELAGRFFSPAECSALRALAGDDAAVVAGFFAAWSRKEAYLKATGHGITRGLHHFDVTLAPGEPARLLADRLDADATRRWALAALDVAPGYSGALAAAAPLGEVLLLDAG